MSSILSISIFCLIIAVNAVDEYNFQGAEELLSVPRKSSWHRITPRDKDQTSGLPPPESAIGYEVECGLRGGRYGESLEEGSKYRTFRGNIAKQGEFPWQVSIQLKTGWVSRHICGGALLSAHWLVTAGHCVANLKPKAITVVAGENDLYAEEGMEQRVEVIRIVNGGYKEGGNFAGDIALVQVNPPFELTARVAPVCLPQSNREYHSGNATVSGWGKLPQNDPNILQITTMSIMSNRHCQEEYDLAGFGRYINRACQICGTIHKSHSNFCQGDSGGPLVCQHEDGRYYLCGIVSWGLGCVRPSLPAVFTEVPCYVDWIKAILYNVNGFVANLPAYSPD